MRILLVLLAVGCSSTSANPQKAPNWWCHGDGGCEVTEKECRGQFHSIGGSDVDCEPREVAWCFDNSCYGSRSRCATIADGHPGKICRRIEKPGQL